MTSSSEKTKGSGVDLDHLVDLISHYQNETTAISEQSDRIFYDFGGSLVNLTGLGIELKGASGDFLTIKGNPLNVMIYHQKDEFFNKPSLPPLGKRYAAIVSEEVGRELSKPEYMHMYHGRFVGVPGLTQDMIHQGNSKEPRYYPHRVTEFIIYKDFTPALRMIPSCELLCK